MAEDAGKYTYCTNCGTKNAATNKFCLECGQRLIEQDKQTKDSRAGNILDNATKEMNSWTGEDKSVEINFKSIFNQVFKKHTQDETDRIFIAGTKETTPTLNEVADKEVRPWLFSRVFLYLSSLLLILLAVLMIFQNSNAYPGLLFMGALSVPFSLLIFFFEINVFKNISIYQVMKIFFIGGAFSLLMTVFIYSLTGSGNFSLLGSLLIGLVEETGKLVIISYFVYKANVSHIFNGMLIGAAIGAGFAVFENAGYAQNYGIAVLLVRSFGSLGSHTIWSAIIGAALVMVKKNHKLTKAHFTDRHFINFYLLSVLLHALWDLKTPFTDVKLVLLIISGWVAIFVLIHAGLREVKELKKLKLKNMLEEPREA